MTHDRDALQRWYRKAMLRRIDELTSLRQRVRDGIGIAELRSVGQALRGSGGTFGFPELSTAAGRVEMTADVDALRRLEGLLVVLRRLSAEERDEGRKAFEWLGLCAGLEPDRVPALLGSTEQLDEAWSRTMGAAGLDDDGLAAAVADRFGLEVARLSDRSSSAQRLVPEAFTAAARVVPLSENTSEITLAIADPTELATEIEVERLTGRRPVFAVAAPAAIDAVLGEAAPEDGAPAAARPAPEATVASAGPLAGGPRGGDASPDPGTVLVVDDEASARLLVGSLLEKRGFNVVEACDGLEALEAMNKRDDVRLAVVDLNMPRMDGLELIWELRDAPEWAALPVIVITGERDELLEAHIMEEGADDYIRKPVDPRTFLARVDATLRRTAQRAPA